MNLDHLPKMESTRAVWVAQLTALPRALWHQLRRLAGRENRYYLIMDGEIIARFVSPDDHLAFCRWLAVTHQANADYSFAIGREFAVATQIRNGLDYIKAAYGDDSKEHAFDLTYADPDAGAAGPS